MTIIDFVFFFYTFIALYMTSLFLFIYWPNRDRIHYYPSGTPEPVSIVMPCYNEGAHIGQAIESLLALDYPKHMIEIIIVDDRSTDNSVELIKPYTKRHANVRLIVNQRNSGGAAEPTNIGIRAARYDYIAVADADSTPQPDALKKMIGFLQTDPTVGGVTCAVLAKEPQTFMQKLQSIEYRVIAFNRKLLDCVDAVYVTPGPFALYKKKVLFEVGLFDPKNLTQDIEIVWRMLSKGYKARMSLATSVYSATPTQFRKWWKQRIRWNIGGTQTLIQYRSLLFRKGMLGAFIIPFFSFSLFLGIVGLGLFTYLLIRRFIVSYLTTHYTLASEATLLRLQDLTFTPSVLNFFGIFLFLIGFGFTLFVLSIMRTRTSTKDKFFNIMFYMLVYLTIYPLIMITGLIKLMRGKYSW